MPRRLILLAALLAAQPGLADGPRPPSTGIASGFVRTDPSDVFGYYMPDAGRSIRAGNFVLRTIALGGADDFAAFESGKERAAAYAPFMLIFDDVTSPKKSNELGQPYYTRSVRVSPSGYRLSFGEISFIGKDPALGLVQFTGKLNRPLIKSIQARSPGGSQETVMAGDLTVGGTAIKNITFTWFGGD